MELNLTDAERELFFTVGTAVNLGLFFVFTLPALILCLLCMLALLLANSINWPIRVVLINIFVVETCTWLALALLLLRLPALERIQLEGDFSCNVVISIFVATSVQRYSATALYAIVVYAFLKYGANKLKWYMILPYILISWIFNLILALAPYSNLFINVENGVLCDSNSQTRFFGVPVALIMLEAVAFSCVMITFSILTYRYMKKNTLESNVDVKRAVAKSLIYLLVSSLFSFISHILPVIHPIIRGALGSSILVELVLLYYVDRVLLKLFSIITPIATIISLKPLRLALKELLMCSSCKRNDTN